LNVSICHLRDDVSQLQIDVHIKIPAVKERLELQAEELHRKKNTWLYKGSKLWHISFAFEEKGNRTSRAV